MPLLEQLDSSTSSSSRNDSGVASGFAMPIREEGEQAEEEDSGQHSSQYCPSLLLGDLGLMLGGQILLPSGAGRERHDVSKVQGDFASGGSHMLASEPQSSAHSEVKHASIEALRSCCCCCCCCCCC